jgi:hypothetical protein
MMIRFADCLKTTERVAEGEEECTPLLPWLTDWEEEEEEEEVL